MIVTGKIGKLWTLAVAQRYGPRELIGRHRQERRIVFSNREKKRRAVLTHMRERRAFRIFCRIASQIGLQVGAQLARERVGTAHQDAGRNTWLSGRLKGRVEQITRRVGRASRLAEQNDAIGIAAK